MEIEIDALGILIMTISCFVSDPRLFRRYSLLVSINFVCCCVVAELNWFRSSNIYGRLLYHFNYPFSNTDKEIISNN